MLFVLGLFGAGLVAAGVSGEFWKESQIAAVETCIRKGNDALFLLLSKEAGDAAASAKIAHAEADAVKGIADEARADAKDALEKAKAAKRELAHAEADAAKAQTVASRALSTAEKAESKLADVLQRVAIAERETARIKGELADRELTDGQLKVIADKLKAYSGQEYNVTAYWESKESLGFANRIHEALQLANWKIVETDKWRGLMGGVIGVFVGYHPEADERTQQAARALVTALSLEGIQAQPQVENPKNNPKHNKISLTVGSKR